MQWTKIPSGGRRGSRNTPSYATETRITANLKGHLAHNLCWLYLRFGDAFCLGLFRTNADTMYKTLYMKMNWFSREWMHRDMHFHTNSFAQRLILPQRQKSTIHPWAVHRALDLFLKSEKLLWICDLWSKLIKLTWNRGLESAPMFSWWL